MAAVPKSFWIIFSRPFLPPALLLNVCSVPDLRVESIWVQCVCVCVCGRERERERGGVAFAFFWTYFVWMKETTFILDHVFPTSHFSCDCLIKTDGPLWHSQDASWCHYRMAGNIGGKYVVRFREKSIVFFVSGIKYCVLTVYTVSRLRTELPFLPWKQKMTTA